MNEEPSLEARLRMYKNIARGVQREYFIWGFVAGVLGSAGVALLLGSKT